MPLTFYDCGEPYEPTDDDFRELHEDLEPFELELNLMPCGYELVTEGVIEQGYRRSY